MRPGALVSLAAAAVFTLVSSAAANTDVILDRTTTGPVPPPGVAPKVARTFGPLEEYGLITGVPGYEWRHGCGPTALGMVIGYHDIHRLDDLIPGDASTQTEEVNQAIASERDAMDPGHYEDYSLPLDYLGGDIEPDKSEPPEGDEHEDDCIADFMMTSWSCNNSCYGWSYNAHIPLAFLAYVEFINPEYSPYAQEYTMIDGALTWEILVREIDAGRPMGFVVDCSGAGVTDHFVTVVGYTDTPTRQYGCLDTWYPADVVRWCDFELMAPGQAWGICKGWALDPNEMVFVDASGGGQVLTIQEGIDAAHSGGNVIVAPGTYTGPQNRDLDFGGKTLTLISEAGPDSTIIDCEGLGRGFNFHSHETDDSIVSGFTIRNGSMDFGGAIRCFWASSPTLENLRIEDCEATSEGGGVWSAAGSAPELTDVAIVGCTAIDGGGVYCKTSSPVLTRLTLHGNSASNEGGGIYCNGTAAPSIANTIIAASVAGEAIYCEPTSVPTITHSCIHGNAAGDSLCGRYAENLYVDPIFCDAPTGDLTLRDDSRCLPGNNAWGEQIGAYGAGGCPTGIDPGAVVSDLALYPPSPNPFTPPATLSYEVPASSLVSLRVHDVAGRTVRTLFENAPHEAGRYARRWDGRDDRGRSVASGVYFVRLEGRGTSVEGRVLLLK